MASLRICMLALWAFLIPRSVRSNSICNESNYMSYPSIAYGLAGQRLCVECLHVNIVNNPEWRKVGSPQTYNALCATDPNCTVTGGMLCLDPVAANDLDEQYTCVHTNTDFTSCSVTFTIAAAALPSAPRTLTVSITDDSSTSGVLQWQNPSDSGLPAFNKFVVKLVSMTSPFINVSRTVTATSTDPFYINTFTVTGLKPNTNYTASVRAVSSLIDVSGMPNLPGPLSNEVSFVTMLGDPKFSNASIENIAGKLNVIWGFRHTGGAPLTRVIVSCVSIDEKDSDDGGLTQAIDCTGNSLCGNFSNDGMLSLPSGSDSVTAGTNYSCTVAATNNLDHTTTHTTNYILVLQGIPSTPMRVMVDSSVPLKVTLMAYFYSGSSTLTFPVTATSKTGGPTHTFTVVIADTSPMLTKYTISIELSPGMYVISFNSSNMFGVSENVDIMALVTSATSNSFTPLVTPTRPPIAPVSAGVIAGAVLAVVAVVLIILIVLLIVSFVIYHNKGQPKSISTADNEAYGVLREDGGVSLPIELKENAYTIQ